MSENNNDEFHDKTNGKSTKENSNFRKPDNVINFSMDDRGKMYKTGGEAAISSGSSKVLLILGWICAALTIFISPLFAVASIVFGIIANSQKRGSGNALIITSVVLAVISLLLALFYTFTGGTLMF